MSLVLQWPFETDFGTVKPGDPIAFLSTHAGSITFARGTYLGVSTSNTKNAVIEYSAKAHGWKHVDNDEILQYGPMKKWLEARGLKWITGDPNLSYVPYLATKRKTLKLNRMIPARG